MGNLLKLCVALLLALPLQAATYYVDFATGSDSNNGTTTGTPFQHCPGDTNCTATADSTTLAAGDTVKFKGGIVYTGCVEIAWSGSTGNPITYDGNHAGDWGTGRAILDGNYVIYGAGLYASSGRSFITVQGLAFQNYAGWADDDPAVAAAAAGTQTNTVNTGGAGINLYTGGSHTNFVFNNLHMQRIGGWRNGTNWTQNTIQGGGIFVKNPSGVVITNCEFTKMKTGIGIYADLYAYNVEVVDVNIHNYITWGVDVAVLNNNGVIRDVSIHDSEIHDYAEFTAGNWGGIPTEDGPHTDGIFLRCAGFTPYTWDNVRIYNNHFYCDDPGNSLGGTASIFLSQGPSALIYNNVFDHSTHQRAIDIGWHNQLGIDEVRVYNNTFYFIGTAVQLGGETNIDRRRVHLANNLYLKPTGRPANSGMLYRDGAEVAMPVSNDYNLFYDPDWSASVKVTHIFPGYTVFTDVPATYGFESNSAYADPLLVSLSGVPSARDLRLQSGSPAIGAGTNLSAYFTTDKNGVARGSVWDIGAFEYQAEPQPTTLNANTLTVQGQAVFGP